MMHVTIHLGEPYWRSAGHKVLRLEIEQRTAVTDLLALLQESWPALGHELDTDSPLIFIDDVQADPETCLKCGDHVHILWPVAGG